MEQNSEDEEDNHQNSRARSLGDNEHSDEADLGKINTDEKLLQSSGVNKTSSVDLGLCDKQDVVTVGKIKESHTNGRPEQNNRSNDSVDNAWERLARDSLYS
jgi:hypothetical protein